MIEIERYQSEHRADWDTFVSGAKNAVFLFNRAYQDYHADRFQDHSYIIRSRGRPVALFPASVSGEVVSSHGGLSFGGVLADSRMTQVLMMEVFDALVRRLQADGVRRLLYKASPACYHALPSGEDLYALHRHRAVLYRRDVNTVLCPQDHPPFQERRARAVKKARNAGILVEESMDYPAFWSILSSVLTTRHQVRPVHGVEEMLLLRSRFPENIRLFTAVKGGLVLAGAVVFVHQRVAHTQYLASSEEGRAQGALDLVIAELITGVFREKDWVSFGISTESGGEVLNEGLTEYKEGFGGRSVMHDCYQLEL